MFKQSRAIYFNPIWPICLLIGFLLCSCNKEVQEPEHKNNGSNVLYFNIDGKGYLLRDRCLDFPSKKTGDIFGSKEKKNDPSLTHYRLNNKNYFSLNTIYRFNRDSQEYGQTGQFTIYFYEYNGEYKFVSLESSMLFYSPIQNRLLNIEDIEVLGDPSFEIGKLDTENCILAGNLALSFKEINKNDTISLYIYFDVKTNNN